MKKRIRVLVILALAALLGWGAWRYFHPPVRPLVLTGIVDGRVVVVSSQIVGRIVRMNVHTGSQVRTGQPLAVLQQNELSASFQGAQSAAAAAYQQWRAGEAQLKLLRASVPAQIAQAQAQLRQAQAQRAQSRANLAQIEAQYRRIVPLAKDGIDSRQLLDESRAQRAAAQAAVTSARRLVASAHAALVNAQAQTLQIRMQQSKQAALLASMKQAQANQSLAQAELEQTNLLAPLPGVVNLRVAYPGEVVNPASPVVTIYDLHDTWVDAYLPESQADLITLGEAVKVKLPSGAIIPGRVDYKTTEAGFATQRDVSRTRRDIRTVAIRVRVANPQGELALGMTCWVIAPRPRDQTRR